MYLMKITSQVTGKTEMLIGDYPNQRDALKYAVLHSVMYNSGNYKPEMYHAEIVDSTMSDRLAAEWLEEYH